MGLSPLGYSLGGIRSIGGEAFGDAFIERSRRSGFLSGSLVGDAFSPQRKVTMWQPPESVWAASDAVASRRGRVLKAAAAGDNPR